MGARLCIAPAEVRGDTDSLCGWLEKERISILSLVATLAGVMLARELPKSLWAALKGLFSVKQHEEHGQHESLRVVMVKQLSVAAPPALPEAASPRPDRTRRA